MEAVGNAYSICGALHDIADCCSCCYMDTAQTALYFKFGTLFGTLSKRDGIKAAQVAEIGTRCCG